MSITYYKRCPYCGSDAKLHPIQNHWICLRGGCEYDEPADVSVVEMQAMDRAMLDAQAVIAEWGGAPCLPMHQRVKELMQPMAEAFAKELQAEQSAALFELNRITERPSAKDQRRGWFW